MSEDQDRNRHASAPNYFARGPYNNRQKFRPGSYYMSQSSFTNRPRTPNQYSYVRPQFPPSSHKPRQQNLRTPNQVRQQFGPRNYNKRGHLSSSLSGDGSNIPLFKGLINNFECSVMRDTCCSMSAASATKVLQSQMTNKKVE